MKRHPRLPDLTFPMVRYSLTAAPWTLLPLLYRGGARTDTRRIEELIANGALGELIEERASLVIKLHEVITEKLISGGSSLTTKGSISCVRRFYAWADELGRSPTLASVERDFSDWTHYLIDRQRTGSLKTGAVYCLAEKVASLLDEVLGRATSLIRTTPVRRIGNKKRALGSQADKQNLEQTFNFGQTLLDIANALTIETIRGKLPVEIQLRSGKKLVEWSRLRPVDTLKAHRVQEMTRDKRESIEKRAAYEADISLRTRHPLVNLRIEAEMLIFIAQTGMNLAQAYKLEYGKFSYMSHLGGYQVRRVYKGRRRGEVEFEIYREYRPVFERYLMWRTLIVGDNVRLFPLESPQRRSPDVAPDFSAVRKRCRILSIPFISPRSLRSTRINWLLRHSRNMEVTAEIAQHAQDTLLRNYIRPNHQLAVMEISRFYEVNEAKFSAPGPGTCVNPSAELVASAPPEAPRPDCVSPAGCLFCKHQRDIDTLDHVWSLATYRYLKSLELARDRSTRSIAGMHPAAAVIERIAAKLEQFEASSSVRERWVGEARARVEEGDFHPMWAGFIQLSEMLV